MSIALSTTPLEPVQGISVQLQGQSRPLPLIQLLLLLVLVDYHNAQYEGKHTRKTQYTQVGGASLWIRAKGDPKREMNTQKPFGLCLVRALVSRCHPYWVMIGPLGRQLS